MVTPDDESNEDIQDSQSNSQNNFQSKFIFWKLNDYLRYLNDNVVFPCYQSNGHFKIDIGQNPNIPVKNIIDPFTGKIMIIDEVHESRINPEKRMPLNILHKDIEGDFIIDIIAEKSEFDKILETHKRRVHYDRKIIHIRTKKKEPEHGISALAKMNFQGLFEIAMGTLHCNSINNELIHLWEILPENNAITKKYFGLKYEISKKILEGFNCS